ncbi:MAG: DUF1684 domain-containing protein [Bacteroidetes bacterium]|jgi:uncharacterized protein|nr:DUF1684 domain-containing protein [Bacteroidota bacterium]MBT5529682.1 DUF1684 domain-containing protein [Cytophagia bacterium]MBT3423183.1 DUF1684 domain-containing protein [Bacteroidota bacterium]MBT3802193.1 DUF1684 domain-containing protein [Bacteroidota bacterium]MBT3935361.1 DUF1684 domain-containing protein [Bacteroidota bacterium]
MKAILTGTLFIIFLNSFAQNSYMEIIEAERDTINMEFSDPETSILKEEDLKLFSGLKFYPPNENYKVEAVFKKIKNGKEFKMKTSTDRLPVYYPYGKLKFSIDGNKYKLTLYKNANAKPEYADYLFLPFTDLTNDDDTYGGGRYLDMEIQDLENPVIDFNQCYNPYCAYNDRYSCPIPPEENFLNLRIEAGVKKFKNH